MIEAHLDRDERRIARRRLERDLAADPPARAERAARHPLPRDMAVGIGEGDREPIEPALMDHERDIAAIDGQRSEEHTSELQSPMRISYAVFCMKKKNQIRRKNPDTT